MIYKIQQTYFVKKQKQTADTCYNINEPQKYYAKLKKPDMQDHILCDSTYTKCPERANLKTESRLAVCLGLKVEIKVNCKCVEGILPR